MPGFQVTPRVSPIFVANGDVKFLDSEPFLSLHFPSLFTCNALHKTNQESNSPYRIYQPLRELLGRIVFPYSKSGISVCNFTPSIPPVAYSVQVNHQVAENRCPPLPSGGCTGYTRCKIVLSQQVSSLSFGYYACRLLIGQLGQEQVLKV